MDWEREFRRRLDDSSFDSRDLILGRQDLLKVPWFKIFVFYLLFDFEGASDIILRISGINKEWRKFCQEESRKYYPKPPPPPFKQSKSQALSNILEKVNSADLPNKPPKSTIILG